MGVSDILKLLEEVFKMTSIVYLIAVLVILVMGFVWNLWMYAWAPILIAVIISKLLKKNR